MARTGFMTTVQLRVEAENASQAADGIGESLRGAAPFVLDWQYLRVGGMRTHPTPVTTKDASGGPEQTLYVTTVQLLLDTSDRREACERLEGLLELFAPFVRAWEYLEVGEQPLEPTETTIDDTYWEGVAWR